MTNGAGGRENEAGMSTGRHFWPLLVQIWCFDLTPVQDWGQWIGTVSNEQPP